MAGRYDITPIDTSTRQKLYGQYNEALGQFLPESELNRLYDEYSGTEDVAFQRALDEVQRRLDTQFGPAMESARARAYGLYGMSGQPVRNDRLIGQEAYRALAGESSRQAAESAARKADYRKYLAAQRIAARMGLGQGLYARMLSTQKRPTTGDKIMQGLFQVGGAAAGSYLGRPPAAQQQPVPDNGPPTGPSMPDPNEPVAPQNNEEINRFFGVGRQPRPTYRRLF